MAATPASMLQLVGYGLQDRERLNLKPGNPDTRYYSYVYKKRTRWASQWRRVDFDNLADFGRRATVTLPILGELITRATLVVELPDIWTPQDKAFQVSSADVYPKWSWTNGIGHAICSSVEMSIGTQVIDRLDSRLCEVLDEQRGPVEHFDSANELIGRNPTNYTDKAYLGLLPTQTKPQTVEVVFPFWWNRGPGPQALPIQALAKDKVQLTVQFRPVQDCVFTSSFVSPSRPGLPGTGPLPTFPGCPFFKGADNTQVPDIAMPSQWHFNDAYWIVEYVSLEDREAAAFRNADLQIPIEQHVAVPVFPTDGAPRVRIPIKQSGLVRDITWVAQREEADGYNAYFLFSRDLGIRASKPNQGIWWPDAQLPNWDYGDGYIRPGFADRRSDPIAAATLFYRGKPRFEMEGPSFFRSLLPALNCRRCPLIDRYIYRYDFGFWPTGGLAETLKYHEDEVRGFANWDKLPARDLLLYMNTGNCGRPSWLLDQQNTHIFTSPALTILDNIVSPTTQAFSVDLIGADATARGAYVSCTIPFQELKRIPGYQHTYVRCVPGGSSSIVVQLAGPSYLWIAVAGGSGAGATGGNAGSAVSIGAQGITGLSTHSSSGGGGGGGGFSVIGSHVVGAAGAPDGIPMPTDDPFFVTLLRKTGGTSNSVAGGDGYYGGGSGTAAGGGGGSYVSTYATQVYSTQNSGPLRDSGARITPASIQAPPPEKFNIYVWLTTYNMLRISAGRGALMFSA